MKTVKSVGAVQRRQTEGGVFKLVRSGGQGGWDVRVRYKDGTETLLIGSFPYTMAQAHVAAQVQTNVIPNGSLGYV